MEAGSDGKLLLQRTFAATKDEYLSGEGQTTVPALNKGQFALIPVSIFLQQELNAAEDVVVDQMRKLLPLVVGGEQKVVKIQVVKKRNGSAIYSKVGQEVTNIKSTKCID